MGFWDWLTGLFGGWFSSGTRDAEEKKEEAIAVEGMKITRTERQMERDEKNKLTLVKGELQSLYSDITKGKIPNNQIRNGSQIITLDQCILGLIRYIEGLIRNKVSISQEIQMFGYIKFYWSLARSGMAGIVSQGMLSNNKENSRAAGKVNKFMKDIGKLLGNVAQELLEEEEFSREKIALVRRQYALIMQEEGARTQAAAPRQVNPAGAKRQINAAQRSVKLKPATALR